MSLTPTTTDQTSRSGFAVFAAKALRFTMRYERRVAMILLTAAVIGGVMTYFALSSASFMGRNPDAVTYLLTYDLIVLLCLGVLVLQRVAGLYQSRGMGRRAASRLQRRMVGMFSVLAITPAILLVLFSTFFFQLGVQSWFSRQVRTAVDGAQTVAMAYLDEHRKVIRSDLLAMASDINRQSSVLYADQSQLSRFMNTQSLLRNFSESAIFTASGRMIARGGVGFFDPADLPPSATQRADYGDTVVFFDDDKDEKIQALVHLTEPGVYLYVNRSVDGTVLAYLAATKDAASNYKNLEQRKSSVQVHFFAIYILVTVLLLLAAVWAGLYIAGQMVRPIENLIAAAQQVREGNLSTRVPEDQGMDEFDDLARTFNHMTDDLSAQRRDLITANHKLDDRRRFTETVLAGVTSGVMAVDADGVIRLVNASAAQILLMKPENMMHQDLAAILPELDVKSFMAGASNDIATRDINFVRRDLQSRFLLIRMARDSRDSGRDGVILTFDDMTELQSAHRKSAWADVARRVAHEIKNPLTPIQLSAERLRRKFMKDIPEPDQAVFEQCVNTIIRHVGDIGRMVGEFAAFARMPEPVMATDDLGVLVREVAELHRAAKDGVRVEMDSPLPAQSPLPLRMDSAQIRQALTNLVLNAAESVQRRLETSPAPQGRVLVSLSRQDQKYILSVLDNGAGFPSGVPLERLSEPYVTFRDKGTGLGLAIVKKIVEDHKGTLQLLPLAEAGVAEGWGASGALVRVILPIPLDQKSELVENTSHAA